MADAMSPGGWRAQFLLLAAIWGSSFLFIKALGERWPPLWVALGRVGLGAITLIAIAIARRERLKLHGRTWLHLLAAAMLANAIPFTLFAYGEQHVSSVVAGLWNATTPLWVLGAAVFVFGRCSATPPARDSVCRGADRRTLAPLTDPNRRPDRGS